MHYIITAGHSNTDPGAVGNGYREADIALVMRELVAMKLRQRGHTVTTDGGGKTNLPLSEAVKLAKQGDIAVEIHCNASHSPTARGVETIALPKDRALAQRISQSIAAVTGQRLRGDAGWIGARHCAVFFPGRRPPGHAAGEADVPGHNKVVATQPEVGKSWVGLWKKTNGAALPRGQPHRSLLSPCIPQGMIARSVRRCRCHRTGLLVCKRRHISR